MKNVYPVLNKNVLLMIQPKGGLIGRLGAPCDYINDTAVEILELCDGTHTLATISDILAERHDEQVQRAFKLVSQFLDAAAQKGHAYYSFEPTGISGTIAGRRDPPILSIPAIVLAISSLIRYPFVAISTIKKFFAQNSSIFIKSGWAGGSPPVKTSLVTPAWRILCSISSHSCVERTSF